MQLKSCVKLRGLQTGMLMGHCIVAHVMSLNDVECTVTSANDSRHGVGSLHFSGAALDYRMKHIDDDATKRLVVEGVKASLGAEFDVIHEAIGTDNEHLHVEWQPKT